MDEGEGIIWIKEIQRGKESMYARHWKVSNYNAERSTGAKPVT